MRKLLIALLVCAGVTACGSSDSDPFMESESNDPDGGVVNDDPDGSSEPADEDSDEEGTGGNSGESDATGGTATEGDAGTGGESDGTGGEGELAAGTGGDGQEPDEEEERPSFEEGCGLTLTAVDPTAEPGLNPPLVPSRQAVLLLQKVEAYQCELPETFAQADPYVYPGYFADLEGNEPFTIHEALMQSFVSSVGLQCGGCHTNGQRPDVLAERQNITLHMWDDIIGELEMADGSPLFCDSCHQGQPRFLDRDDPASVDAYMRENMVGKLRRRDGKEHGCASCHGNSSEYGTLIDDWSIPFSPYL